MVSHSVIPYANHRIEDRTERLSTRANVDKCLKLVTTFLLVYLSRSPRAPPLLQLTLPYLTQLTSVAAAAPFLLPHRVRRLLVNH